MTSGRVPEVESGKVRGYSYVKAEEVRAGGGLKIFGQSACQIWKGHYICVPLFAGWSSPVARQAHNLKVVGSNPAPATNF
jgi:hypothetical protein